MSSWALCVHRAPSAEFDYSDERAGGQIHNIVKEFGFIRGDQPEHHNLFFHLSEFRDDEAQVRAPRMCPANPTQT